MLSPSAERIITKYFSLPFPGLTGVRCPYFNNARLKQRGQLRVLVGKGSPEEIVEESKIISVQYKAGLFDINGNTEKKPDGQPFTPEEVRKFLVDHNLGIECSGFVTQVLKAHYKETKKINLTRKVFISSPKNFLRWIISRLRPIENMDVKIYADERNSTKIIGSEIGYNYENVEPGDTIIMLETGPLGKRNHILLIRGKEGNMIEYVHARAWSKEGKYGHGVSSGVITITHPLEDLLKQEWTENNLREMENETFMEAKQAKVLEIRRLKI